MLDTPLLYEERKNISTMAMPSIRNTNPYVERNSIDDCDFMLSYWKKGLKNLPHRTAFLAILKSTTISMVSWAYGLTVLIPMALKE